MNEFGKFLYRKFLQSKQSAWRTDIWLYLYVIFDDFSWEEFLKLETLRFSIWYWTHCKTLYVIKEFYVPKIKS